MEKVWKKESRHRGALYIDLFASVKRFTTYSTPIRQKNDHFSTESRNKGNDLFRLKQYSEAMALYNQSLRFAKVDSENVALAYSNRSACFFHLRMYDEALNDIELSKAANVPRRLLQKLMDRKDECEKLKASVKPSVKPKVALDFEVNKKFPCLANVVGLKRNKEFGRHLIATTDIPVGKTVLLEDAFLLMGDNEENMCNTCFKTKANFIACSRCSEALFCNAECMNGNLTHIFECGTIFPYLYDDDKARMLSIKFHIRMVLLAIAIFSNVEELMQFIENVLLNDPDSTPNDFNDLKSKYHSFLKLCTAMPYTTDFLCRHIFDRALALPKVKALFDSKRKQRFLMHLVLHHFHVLGTNCDRTFFENCSILSIANYTHLINHSCVPNIMLFCTHTQKYCITVRPVIKGEQLFACYRDFTDMKFRSKEERQQYLKFTKGFTCKCEKCEPVAQHKPPEMMRSYFELMLKLGGESENDVAKYEEFLNKYGHSPCSEEAEVVSFGYTMLLKKKIGT